MRPMPNGEADIRDADLEEAAGGLEGGAELVGEEVEAFDGNSRQQADLVAEMVRRRGVRHPGPPSELSEADAARPVTLDSRERLVEEGAPQVAVVVSTPSCGCRHARSVAHVSCH